MSVVQEKASMTSNESAAQRPEAASASGGGSPLRIYKSGQGTYVRWGSAAGAGVLILAFAQFLYDQLAWFGFEVQTLVPVAIFIALGFVMFRMLGQNKKVVDFMIATEGEMRKVNWSTRKEVFGATRVVIFVLLAMGFFLFIVDVLFILFFESIGVLHLGLLQRMFSGGSQ